MVWSNPPYNAEVKTSIGKVFLKLIQKYFHKNYRYKKMFNTNTIKRSYSCTKDVKNLIKQHNSSIKKTGTNINKKDCNFWNKDNYLLDAKCLVECIVYEATVFTANQTNTNFGWAEGDFESRYTNHKVPFHSKGYKHRTQLSKYVWSLKNINTECSLKWHVKAKAVPYKCDSRKCELRENK